MRWIKKYIVLGLGLLLFLVGIYCVRVPFGGSMFSGVLGLGLLLLAFCVTAIGLGIIAAMPDNEKRL